MYLGILISAYRQIEAEKKRLTLAGVGSEEMRLLRRFLSNPRNERAERPLEFRRKPPKSSMPLS